MMAKTTFFGSSEDLADGGKSFDFTREYPFQEQLVDVGNALSKVINQCLTRLLLCHLDNYQFSRKFSFLPIFRQFAGHFQW